MLMYSENIKDNILKPHALNFSYKQWEEWFFAKNWPKYRPLQVYEWIYKKNLLDPKKYTNLPQTIRSELLEEFQWGLPEIRSSIASLDDSQKFLLKTFDGLVYEMVLMFYENRTTLCMSSQVGCKMGCSFCQTGKVGFKRNLSTDEMLAQVLLANQFAEKNQKEPLSNVVFMGMGEPLDNYEAVVATCRILVDPKGLSLSKAKVTISTSGLVPEIQKLSQDLEVRLAISLHAANEEKRSKIMPINRKYPLADLKKALLAYPAAKRYGITIEYVMIQGINDSILDAKELVHFIHGFKAKVNLIPFNHFPGVEMKASDEKTIKRFQNYLSARSIPAPVRYSRAQDISGGCGQLAAKHQEELMMDPRILHRIRRQKTAEKI